MLMRPPSGSQAQKGRGTVWAIEHRFSQDTRQELDDGWGTLEQAAQEEQASPDTVITHETVGRILSSNDSPDVGFDLSINPYRGCEHGCIYCYARPTHSWLNLSPGLDFETRIVAKINAAEKLRETLAARGYQPSYLNIGSITDAYQPAERQLKITRSVIEVLAEARHAFSVITKSSLVERDIDLLAPLAAERLAAVYVSLTTLDPELARTLEPRAAAPHRRLRTIRALAEAGIPVGVSVSPVPLARPPFHQQRAAAAAVLRVVRIAAAPAERRTRHAGGGAAAEDRQRQRHAAAFAAGTLENRRKKFSVVCREISSKVTPRVSASTLATSTT